MKRSLLKSKIHQALVTEADLDYEGSLTLDPVLMEAADLLPHEKVSIFNVTNGHRFFTYVIEGGRGTNVVCVNGAAAHLAREGDSLIIASFASYDESECKSHTPKLVYVDERNNIKSIKSEVSPFTISDARQEQ
ncbi:MAG: aspartate 1-decarboxylase [Candidatus Dadabacteria bacterium]|nr:aspartate 1-decarboxylase [Candidatus Dadabacteria bacterium]MCY4043136.1 aspartate 1-decarboxylase [Candidatus Dadabacteria bacterium]MCY4047023.1 aspartate 1-decarboxylase [Candidatus Dadabacteria bacterium]